MLIVSDSDDINLLPPGFKPIAFNTDKRVFYSKHNKDKARILVEDCGIKIETAKIEATKILRFGANSIVFVLIQIIFQGAGFYLNFVDF